MEVDNDDPRVKQLRIKTGVLKRAVREKEVYTEEWLAEKAKLVTMTNENRDPAELRKQVEIIRESEMMIPDCEDRITFAYNDLKNLLQETEDELAQRDEFLTAKTILDGVVF